MASGGMEGGVGYGQSWNNNPQEEDELYGGFGTTQQPGQNPTGGFDTTSFAYPSVVGGMQRPPPSQGQWGGTSGWAGGPPQSGMQAMKTMDARPMTSNRASGYTAQGTRGGMQSQFDPLKQGHLMGQAPPLQKRSDNSPEERCLEVEKKVNSLIEESAMLALHKDYPLALEKAIEAAKRERALCKEREKLNLGDQINIDLTYSVHFNLAVQYHNNQLYSESLNTYSLIVRNKQYVQSGRLRVNMGNIYAEQKKYNYAIKMYKLALDQVPPTGKELRYKITRNIANAFVKLGQYQDAINHYEAIMKEAPDIQTGFNLLLCYYILRDKERMKRHFLKLLQIRMAGATDDEDDEENEGDDKDVFMDDGLLRELKERRKQHTNFILTAGRLIAPVVESDWEKGFDFVVSSLKQTRVTELKHSTSKLASEMEMCWALQYLKHQKYTKAIECLKAFEKKDKALRARSSTNLSYLYFLEGDMENGEKYADMSVEADKYNAKALVNKGNFLYMKGEYDRAKEFYLEALSVEADCIEAIYNLGLATKQLFQYVESLRVFKRLQTMVDAVEVVYQLANLYELIKRNDRAVEWFNRLVTRVPTDPAALARLGTIHAKEEDESQAFHYHLESYRYFPVNMEVINWLGAYFVKNEVYEKAMKYFERASQIQPNEVKWQLLVASCYRRIGAFPQAKRLYEEIHQRHPENAECPRYLVHLCREMGLTDEAIEYHKILVKLGKVQDHPVAATNGTSEGESAANQEPASEAPGATSRHAADLQAMASMEREGETQDALQVEEAKAKAKAEEDDELDDEDLPGM